jgi:DNA polymerase-3 subunit delta'
MLLKDVIGQEAIKAKIIGSVHKGRIPHAQLFLSNPGAGGLPLALAYAQYITCTNRTEVDSCGDCNSCKKHQSFTHPDVHFSYPFVKDKGELSTDLISDWRAALKANPYMNYMDWMQFIGAEKKQGNIPIKENRDIIKRLSLKPYEAEFKFMILWLPEYLGKEGNVLLKIIEEPPQNTLFILVAENADRILGTILSRAQLVRIPPIQKKELKQGLMDIHSLTDEQAERMAQISQGSYRTCQDLLIEAESPYYEIWKNWMTACYTVKLSESASLAEKFHTMSRDDLKGFLQYGLELLRGIMVVKYESSLNNWVGKEYDFIQNFNKLNIPFAKLTEIIAEMENSIYLVERNSSVKMVMMDLSFYITKRIKK